MTKEELQKQLKELQEQLADKDLERDDAVAAAVQQVHENYAKGEKLVISDHPTITLDLEDVDGNAVEGEYTIPNQYPNVRLVPGINEVIPSNLVLKKAAGEDVSEQEKVFPEFTKMDADKVKAILADWYKKGSAMVVKLGMILFLLAFSFQLSAQIGSGRIQEFDLDTLSNADTISLDFFKQIKGTDYHDYTWAFDVENISGTTAGNIYIEESMLSGDSTYVRRDTIAISGDSSFFVTGNVLGFRHRAYIITSGTHSTSIRAVCRIRRRENF